MTTPSKLLQALASVDWTQNIGAFGGSAGVPERVERCNLRVALWAKQIESAEGSNPAIPFVRELQIQGHHAAALLALALYKPSAAAMRGMVESALYHTYFRLHPAELGTLVRDPSYFVQKSDVIEYHLRHTARFREREQRLSLITRLNPWYRNVSALVHGQIPGGWVGHTRLADIKHDAATLEKAVATLEDGEQIIHALFLCTVAQDLWGDFAAPAKKELLKGLSGDIKAELGLTAA